MQNQAVVDEMKYFDPGDVSYNFSWNLGDSMIAQKLIELEQTPEAIKYFSKVCGMLSNYAYWFFLSTLWVSYTGFSDLELWKRLFSAARSEKKTSLMKPSEVRSFDALPQRITAYRAHRPGETDWIAYTLDLDTAARFAREREVSSFKKYYIRKKDITALFLRRGEHEIILLDKAKAEFKGEITLVLMEEVR